MIKKTLNSLLKKAMKEKDIYTKNVIRQIQSKTTEYCISQNIDRNTDDDGVWKKVILSYRQSIVKALNVIKKGKPLSELIPQYEFEILFCSQFLPKQLTEDEITELITKKISESTITNIGRLIGMIMKESTPGTVDAKIVKQIATRLVG